MGTVSSNRHPSHPLQARNPQQTQPQLEGVGAEAAEGQAGAAGGAGGLGQRQLVVDAAGAQGRERHHGLYPRLQQWPSECMARRSCVAQWTGGSGIRYPAPLRGIHYN